MKKEYLLDTNSIIYWRNFCYSRVSHHSLMQVKGGDVGGVGIPDGILSILSLSYCTMVFCIYWGPLFTRSPSVGRKMYYLQCFMKALFPFLLLFSSLHALIEVLDDASYYANLCKMNLCKMNKKIHIISRWAKLTYSEPLQHLRQFGKKLENYYFFF